MAAAAILNLFFLFNLVKWSIFGDSRLHFYKISFISVNRRQLLLFVQKSQNGGRRHLGFYFC